MASSTGLFMVLVAMFWSKAMAQSDCTSVIVSLAPCLNYVAGSSSTPSTSCCSQLAGVVQTQPRCLCEVVNGGASSAFGVPINRTLALALPGACNVQTPPVSECNVGSPEGSPGDYSNSPSVSISSTTEGSKTFPATSGSTSINMALQLIPFVLFMISYASAYITF